MLIHFGHCWADCDDSNPLTTDSCNNYQCEHEQDPYCGDGIVQAGEQCEFAESK